MKIFIKYTAFSVLLFGHDLSTYAFDSTPSDSTTSDLSSIDTLADHTRGLQRDMPVNASASTAHSHATADIRAVFEAEVDTQIRQAATLFGRIYGRTIDTTPEYLLAVLDEACTFLGDGAPFRLDDVASLRKCQSFLKPLDARSRRSITKPGNFDEHSFVPRLIVPMVEFIVEDSDFSEEEKILATTYFDKADSRIFDFDNSKYESALHKPLVLKFFLLKTLSKCIVDFHVIIKMMLIEQLRGVAIPLSEMHKNQVLASLTSFAVNATHSPNALIDGRIASIVHKNIGHLGSDEFLNTVRADLLEYFSGDYLHYLSQMCLSERI